MADRYIVVRAHEPKPNGALYWPNYGNAASFSAAEISGILKKCANQTAISKRPWLEQIRCPLETQEHYDTLLKVMKRLWTDVYRIQFPLNDPYPRRGDQIRETVSSIWKGIKSESVDQEGLTAMEKRSQPNLEDELRLGAPPAVIVVTMMLRRYIATKFEPAHSSRRMYLTLARDYQPDLSEDFKYHSIEYCGFVSRQIRNVPELGEVIWHMINDLVRPEQQSQTLENAIEDNQRRLEKLRRLVNKVHDQGWAKISANDAPEAAQTRQNGAVSHSSSRPCLSGISCPTAGASIEIQNVKANPAPPRRESIPAEVASLQEAVVDKRPHKTKTTRRPPVTPKNVEVAEQQSIKLTPSACATETRN